MRLWNGTWRFGHGEGMGWGGKVRLGVLLGNAMVSLASRCSSSSIQAPATGLDM